MSVGAYGVNYVANRTFLGIGDGAVDTNNRLHFMADSCPNTRMVLGGFSQGAAVMDVAAAVPVARIPLGAPLAPPRGSRCGRCGFPQSVQPARRPITALSSTLGYKAIDLRNGADPICSDGRDVSAHSLYVQSGMTGQAASFVAGRV